MGHQARGGVCGDRAQFYRDRDMEPQWTVLFPDACFYEFIPETEMYKNLDDPSYVPRTICMDEVAAGEVYEIVLTVLKGGAFAGTG